MTLSLGLLRPDNGMDTTTFVASVGSAGVRQMVLALRCDLSSVGGVPLASTAALTCGGNVTADLCGSGGAALLPTDAVNTATATDCAALRASYAPNGRRLRRMAPTSGGDRALLTATGVTYLDSLSFSLSVTPGAPIIGATPVDSDAVAQLAAFLTSAVANAPAQLSLASAVWGSLCGLSGSGASAWAGASFLQMQTVQTVGSVPGTAPTLTPSSSGGSGKPRLSTQDRDGLIAGLFFLLLLWGGAVAVVVAFKGNPPCCAYLPAWCRPNRGVRTIVDAETGIEIAVSPNGTILGTSSEEHFSFTVEADGRIVASSGVTTAAPLPAGKSKDAAAAASLSPSEAASASAASSSSEPDEVRSQPERPTALSPARGSGAGGGNRSVGDPASVQTSPSNAAGTGIGVAAAGNGLVSKSSAHTMTAAAAAQPSPSGSPAVIGGGAKSRGAGGLAYYSKKGAASMRAGMAAPGGKSSFRVDSKKQEEKKAGDDDKSSTSSISDDDEGDDAIARRLSAADSHSTISSSSSSEEGDDDDTHMSKPSFSPRRT